MKMGALYYARSGFEENSYHKQNGLAKALRQIGRIERTLFMFAWFRDLVLRRRVQAGLNKGEARNVLAVYIAGRNQGQEAGKSVLSRQRTDG